MNANSNEPLNRVHNTVNMIDEQVIIGAIAHYKYEINKLMNHYESN